MKNPVSPDPAAPEGGSPPLITGAHGNAAMRVGNYKPTRDFSPLDIFKPNRLIPKPVLWGMALVELFLALALWSISPYKVLPQPGEVLTALGNLWMHFGLGQELAASFLLNLKALLWASLLSLGLAYLTVLPVFRPIVAAISKGRFLSLVGFSFIFTLTLRDGRAVQLALLTYAITVFYLTGMASVIAAIPKSEFDHARTLRMSEWRVVWEIVILGTADKAFEVLRQNAAMGWMMLSLVEGIVRSGGGIGNMLINEQKYLRMQEVFAIQLVFLLVGLLQDYGINFLRFLVCPYAHLTLERK